MTEGAPAVTLDDAIAVLNRIHKADPAVMAHLVGYRVLCNRAVADDPAVQVGVKNHGGVELYEVGLLGILNGIFGTQPGTEVGWIAAHYDDADGRLTGFQRYEP